MFLKRQTDLLYLHQNKLEYYSLKSSDTKVLEFPPTVLRSDQIMDYPQFEDMVATFIVTKVSKKPKTIPIVLGENFNQYSNYLNKLIDLLNRLDWKINQITPITFLKGIDPPTKLNHKQIKQILSTSHLTSDDTKNWLITLSLILILSLLIISSMIIIYKLQTGSL